MDCLIDNYIRSLLLIGSLLLLYHFPIYSQQEEYRMEEIPFTGELLNFNGSCMLQDSEGFMWFGSTNGLYRYDGIDFKVFQHDPFDPGSIPVDHIIGLTEDSGNQLWVATNWGLVRFDKSSEQFDRSSYDNYLWTSMHDDKRGNFWLGGFTGNLSKYEIESGTMSDMISSDFLTQTQDQGIEGLFMDRSGSMWIRSVNNRLYEFESETKSLEEIDNVPCGLGVIYEDLSGRLWITSKCGLYLFNRENNTLERHLFKPGDPNRLNNQIVCDIIEDQRGNLWVRTYDGIYKYSHDLELKFHWYNPELYELASYESYKNSLMEDNTGTIWFFDRTSIKKLTKEYENFAVFNPDPPATNINSFIFLVNDDSLFYCNWSENYYTYNLKSKVIEKNSLPPIHVIFEDSRGVVWIGTTSGLFRSTESDTKNTKYIRYESVSGDSSSLPGMHINYIFEDSYGKLWIACRAAPPCYYDRSNDCFIQLVDNPNSSDHLSFASQVRYETERRELWAINSGVYKIIPPFIRISDHAVMASNVIEFVAPNPTGLILSNFYATHQDERGALWLGDKSMGLFKMTENPESNSEVQLDNYSVRDGLPSNFIVRIQEDTRGILWLGTNMGLSKFDPQLETFTNFNMQDGIPVDRFQNASAINSRGEIFMGTTKGMISFHPDSIRLNTRVPPVKLTGFLIHNQEIIPSENAVLKQSVQFTDSVSLSHEQNTVTISFAVLNYIQPERNQYKYMLEGLDRDWVYSGQQNNVTYAGLKAGKYLFKTAGSNNDGIWNQEGATLAIHILPPPWLTWWAYAFYILFLSGVGLLIWRYQVNRAKMRTAIEIERIEKEQVQELNQLKSRFFTNISHEFRTPLTLIAGPVNDLLRSDGRSKDQERQLLSIVKRNARRLHQLINQLLEISKLETGRIKLNVSEGDLSGFLRSVALSYLSLAEKNRIRYSVDVNKYSEPFLFDRDKVEKISANLISNALKFTPESGSVRVSLIYIPHPSTGHISQAKIIVSDTGPGIPAEERDKVFDRFYQVVSHEGMYTEGSGIGLALAKEIVDLYRGEIKLESEVGKGSTFSVLLPISRELFREDEISDVASDSDLDPQVESDLSYAEEGENPVWKDLREESDKDNPMILIVEDNSDLRAYISHSLALNHQILVACNGAEGLEKAREYIPELVITDLMMPVMDGLEMCRSIKQDERTSHIPVIILTAKADQATKLESLETGADDYLVKPFDSSELNARVRNLIEQRNNLRKKFSREFFLKEPNKEVLNTDERFLEKVSEIIKDHLTDADFSVESFSRLAGLSNSQLYRKLNGIARLSPSQFIRNLRLKHSLLLLEKENGNIARIAYQVGFSDHAYYSKCFRELYGISPTEYVAGKQGKQAVTSSST